MSVPSGRLQFFVLEASDYLERLALVVGRPVPPDPGELVRLTRALRGAALMAGLAPYARAAGALELLAKAHRSAPGSWTPDRAASLADAVDELRRLASRGVDWTDADSDAAAALADSLAAGLETDPDGTPAAPRRAAGQGEELQPSVRAFIGREGAHIAATLEDAAAALDQGRLAGATDAVLARLQPLRGLATLPSLSPLPEFLDAVELTIRNLRDASAPPGGARALRHAATAVAQLARGVAAGSATGSETPDVLLGAASLLESFGRDDDVVDIATLFRDDDANPILAHGNAPSADDSSDSMLELVSLADRLRQAGDQLTQPASITGRTLYLYGLVVQLRPLTAAAPRQRPHLAPLLGSIAAAIGQGRAARDPLAFASSLREAATAIGSAASARNAIFLGDELEPVVTMVRQLGSEATAPPAADESDVVPIESLAPDPAPQTSPDLATPDPGDVVPIQALAPDLPDPAVPGAFEQSFSTYHRLVGAAPAAGNLGITPPAAAITSPDDDADVVDIGTLLFQGRRALERADIVRLELSGALKAERPFSEIEPLVSELIDLVPLALAE
ncbi:MAG: Hpt domain-containing protein [Gemmatimonadales bacterium]|nr:Hpt domain-containing protein [Gemmatimonadales bacterium]